MVIVGAALALLYQTYAPHQQSTGTIKVGILHSRTGELALEELALIDALLFGINKVNKQGGLLGKQLEPIVVNGASDITAFRKQTQFLIEHHKVDAIFGALTSACKNVVEEETAKSNTLFVYSAPHESHESTTYHAVYLGMTFEQRIIPALSYISSQQRHKVLIVTPQHTENIKQTLALITRYAPLFEITVLPSLQLAAEDNAEQLAERINALKPNAVLCFLDGITSSRVYRHITSKSLMWFNFWVTEQHLAIAHDSSLEGTYATWSYFQTIANPANQIFSTEFKKTYGSERVISDPMESSYTSVLLWAEAVRRAQSLQADEIKKSLQGLEFEAPTGFAYVDPADLHLWQKVRIGRVTPERMFEVVYESNKLVRPHNVHVINYEK